MRNLKAHQASSGTAGRRVSDFISSLSWLVWKITVIKKAAKYSAERKGILSSPPPPVTFSVAGCFLHDLSVPPGPCCRALCGARGMVITASLADVVLISRERCRCKMRVPTQWTQANRKVIPARAMIRPFSPHSAAASFSATLSLRDSCDIAKSIPNAALIALSVRLSTQGSISELWHAPSDPNTLFTVLAPPFRKWWEESEHHTYLVDALASLVLCRYSPYLANSRGNVFKMEDYG